MSTELLDKFFKETEREKKELPSAVELAFFRMTLDGNQEINDRFDDLTGDLLFKTQPERNREINDEREEIESACSYDQVVLLMRRGIDSANHTLLIQKALTFEEEIIPDIIRRLKTNLIDEFIEIATRVLVKCKMDVAEELIGYFDDVRNPYAQAMILLVLGFKADETHIPWLIEKYKEFEDRYPDEDFSDGAFLALLEIESRFNISDQARPYTSDDANVDDVASSLR